MGEDHKDKKDWGGRVRYRENDWRGPKRKLREKQE